MVWKEFSTWEVVCEAVKLLLAVIIGLLFGLAICLVVT
jgi:hypothetical protein